MSVICKAILYRGRLDCMGLPFGELICDLGHLPWKEPLVEVPMSFVSLDGNLSIGGMEITVTHALEEAENV